MEIERPYNSRYTDQDYLPINKVLKDRTFDSCYVICYMRYLVQGKGNTGKLASSVDSRGLSITGKYSIQKILALNVIYISLQKLLTDDYKM